jgi:hypothetical protein
LSNRLVGSMNHGKGGTMDTAEFARPERRRHRLFITRNTEYHVRDGYVVAVRPRGSTEWLLSHSALGMSIQGGVRGESPVPQPGDPGPGERLYLTSPNGKSLITSTIVSVERPPKVDVANYPSLAA